MGDPPAALPFASILFKLIGAEAEALELAYLVVVCRHFGEEFGDRYRVLLDRATECGVYPVPELVDPEEPSAARAAPKGLFNDFSLDDDATGQTAEAPEAEWRLAPVVTPKEKIKLLDRTRHVPPPAGPLVDQTRLAREALYETRDRPARRAFWRLIDSLDR